MINGSGIGRIKKLCKEHGIAEPKFEELQKGFQVILYKQKILTTQETTQETTRDKIIKLLKANCKYTKKDLMTMLHKGDSTIKEHLDRLKRDGVIKRVGSTKAGYWEVLDV